MATLVLIVVAIIGAAAVALIMGSFSSNVSQQANTGNTASGSSVHILIADTPLMYSTDQQLAKQYSTANTGVNVNAQNSGNDGAAITAVGLNIADIAAISAPPNDTELAKYPNLNTFFAGGRAIVMIANSQSFGTNAVSQADLMRIYSQYQNNISANLTGLKVVVRNTDGQGSEYIFAKWLTNGGSSSLDNFTNVPNNVACYNATSEADVIAKVSSTAGAIGFVDWEYLRANNVSGVKVMPIVDKLNGKVQTPTDQGIRAEIVNMDGNNYDPGLIAHEYYVVNGYPDSLVDNYLDWVMSPASSPVQNSLGTFGTTDLGIVNNMSTVLLTRTIVDMDGRTVVVPYTINNIVTTHNPLNNMLVFLAPNTLVVSSAAVPSTAKYINLPIRSAVSAGGTLGDEQILYYDPDIVLYDYYQGGNTEDALNTKASRLYPIPVVAVKNVDDATSMSSEITFVGNVVGNPAKASQLNAFYGKVLNYVNATVATIPADKKKKVYYAEGTNGTQTDGPWSYHSQLIAIAGGINVANYNTPLGANAGLLNSLTQVSPEQILSPEWNPDVIICYNQAVYSTITDNGQYNNNASNWWKDTNAYKNHTVYQAPTQPLNWLDRPPGVNRVIGIPWMAKAIYPEYFNNSADSMSMRNLTKEFYSSFYNYNLNDTEVNTLLYTPSSGGFAQEL